jgi:hypothetical protein
MDTVVAFTREYSRVIVSIGNVCVLTSTESIQGHTKISGEDREDSSGSTKDELRLIS